MRSSVKSAIYWLIEETRGIFVVGLEPFILVLTVYIVVC